MGRWHGDWFLNWRRALFMAITLVATLSSGCVANPSVDRLYEAHLAISQVRERQEYIASLVEYQSKIRARLQKVPDVRGADVALWDPMERYEGKPGEMISLLVIVETVDGPVGPQTEERAPGRLVMSILKEEFAVDEMRSASPSVDPSRKVVVIVTGSIRKQSVGAREPVKQ